MKKWSSAAASAALLVTLIAAAPAGAAWSVPQTLSPATVDAAYPEIAVEPDGDALIAWQATGTSGSYVLAAKRTAAGTVGPARRINGTGTLGYRPRVAVNANGQGIVVWKKSFGWEDMRLQARTVAADGTLGAIKTLSAGYTATQSSGGIGSYAVGIDGNGRARVAWTRLGCTDRYSYCDRLQMRTLAADGTLGATATMSATGVHASDVDVAVQPDGRAAIVWSSGAGGAYNPDQILLRSITPAGAVSAAVTMSDPGAYADHAQVAIAGTGRAIAVWEVNTGGIQIRHRETSGTRSAIRVLATVDPNLSHELAQLGLDANGNAIVAWKLSGYLDDDNDPTTPKRQVSQIEARRVPYTGALGAIKNISGASAEAENPQIAVAPSGASTVVWRGLRDTAATGLERAIVGRHQSATGVLGTKVLLSPAGAPGEHGEAFSPQIGVNGNGRFLAVWERFNDEGTYDCCWRAQVSAGP